MTKKDKDQSSVVVNNRYASHEYHILDRYEAGISLVGSEVKSLREGRVNIKDAYVRFKGTQAFVVNLHISPYSHVSFDPPEPDRERKLLLNQAEIQKLMGQVTRKGFTCIPIKLYFKGSWAKLQIAICQGKQHFDKRESLKKKIHQREIDRSIKNATRN